MLDRLRELGPLVRIRFGGSPAWLTTCEDTLAAAFRDAESLPPPLVYRAGIEPLIGETFQSMDGERHRLFRRLATPSFRPRALDRLDDTIFVEVAHELIDRFADDGHADLVRQFSEKYPHIVIARLLGLPRDEEDRFASWVVGILDFSGNPTRAVQCRDELWTYLDPVIEDRLAKPRDDVISHLLHADEDGVRMTSAQVKSHVALMFSAGAATTHDSIGNLIYGVASSDGCWERLRAEPELRRGAIEEALRWEAAISFLPRLTRPDRSIELAGTTIEPSTFVIMGIAAANHDPAVRENPHAFDIMRPPDRTMTFGYGERSCPGMHLAKKEIRVTLDALLERLPGLRLSDPEAAAPCGTIFRHPELLEVSF